jgi:DNA-3-methyladenine glycosylase II
MLLIFALNRPDVWPVDDLGIQESVFRHWPRKFAERPKGKLIQDFADKWRPWRSVASWYLWRGLKPVGTVKRVGD